MTTLKLTFLLPIFFLFWDCDTETLVAPEELQPVIQAYLYANEAVDDIKITQTMPLDVEEGTKAPPINDAIVQIIKNGQVFSLQLSEGDSGYYFYNGTDLTVSSGDIFNLEVEYGGELITAQTVVPQPTVNVQMSANQLKIPDFENIIGGDIGGLDEFRLTVTWDSPGEELFFVVIENLEQNPIAIESQFQRAGRRRTFPPSRRTEFNFSAFQATHYGTHLFKVYHVNQEYADLYDTQEQDSRDLNEPLTNIENGLGVFSAFSAQEDSLFLEIQPY